MLTKVTLFLLALLVGLLAFSTLVDADKTPFCEVIEGICQLKYQVCIASSPFNPNLTPADCQAEFDFCVGE